MEILFDANTGGSVVTNLSSIYGDEPDPQNADNVRVLTFLLSDGCRAIANNVQPAFGSAMGSTLFTIHGSGFFAPASVTFGQVAATNVAVSVDGMTITGLTPQHASGTFAVVVTTPDGLSTPQNVQYTFMAAPTGLDARAVSASQVSVTWNAVSGASSYKLERKAPGGAFTQIATPASTSYSDPGVVAATTYVYRVSAVDSGGIASSPSMSDVATTMLFTAPDPLTTGTVVRAQHLFELRQAVAAVRTAAGLSTTWATDPAASASALVGVPVRATHVSELRSQLQGGLTALCGSLPAPGCSASVSNPSYTDPTLTSGATYIRTQHFQEIREVVR